MTIGERIKNYREQAGMTQQELASKAGVSYQAISKYENGVVTNIPTKRLQIIADALGTNGAVLMGYEESGAIGRTDMQKNEMVAITNPDLLALLEAARGLGEEDLKQLIWMAKRMNQAAAAEGQALHEELDRQLAKEKGTQAKSQA